MADYTEPTLTNYNDNPPSNDGSQSITDNLVDWSLHINEIGDPLKNYIDAVNSEANSAFAAITGRQPANVKAPPYNAVGNGVTDDRAAIQSCIDANPCVYIPPGVYIINGQLTMPDLCVICSDGLYGNSDSNIANANAKLIFTGTASACIVQADTGTPLLHAGLTNITLRSTGTYDWILDLQTVVGLKMAQVRMETNQLATGGIRTTKINPSDNSWVLNWVDVGIRVPDNGTAYALDTDCSDGTFLAGNATGGKGTILRGSGALKFMGGRYDRSSGSGITISVESESLTTHQIIGCQLDENAGWGITVDGDADDTRTETWVMFLITGCNFRNPAAASSIRVLNATGGVLRGGVIGENIYASQAGVVPIAWDMERWTNLTIMPGGHSDSGAVHPRFYLGQAFKQPPLVLAKSAAQSAHSGAAAEETLGTISVPGNSLGASGQMKITTTWTHVNSATLKALRVKYGGTTFTDVTVTTSVVTRIETIITNGTATTQKASALDMTGTGTSTGALVSGTVDTTSAQDILITGQPGAPEAMALESFLIEIIPDDS